MDERREERLNPFIEPIILKKRDGFNFKAKACYKKLMKECDNMSPTFYTMWSIHEFLTLLRYCYMYDNNNDRFHLFIASPPKNNRKSVAMVYKEKGFSITFVLINNHEKEIAIRITRTGQNMNESEEISFVDGEYEIKDSYEAEKFLFITSCLMNGVKELVTYYYENKRF